MTNQNFIVNVFITSSMLCEFSAGDLHFVHILHEDYRDGRTYACIVMNTIMRSIQRGAYAKIYPEGRKYKCDSPPGS